ncbi:MAG: hypothetical protein ABFS03_03530 [Chloroflexota bacterium]
MTKWHVVLRKSFIILLVLIFVYLGVGLGFHFKWQGELDACRERQIAQGQFVEPEVFGGMIGLLFDVTSWPWYVRANILHWGTAFATPCDH